MSNQEVEDFKSALEKLPVEQVSRDAHLHNFVRGSPAHYCIMQDSFKTTLIQGNLGTCRRNILPIRHKRSHDTSSGESSTKKIQTPSQNDLISSCSTFPSRTVHMRARQILQNGCLNMGENIIKKGMCSYQRYGV